MGIAIKLDRDYIINGHRYYLSHCFLGCSLISLISYYHYTYEEAKRIAEEALSILSISEVILRSVEGAPEAAVIELRGVDLKEARKWQV